LLVQWKELAKMSRQAIVRVAIVVLPVLIVGCGKPGASPTSKVTGTVTYQGAPLANVNVNFTPDEGRPGTGTTDAQGRYTISTFAPNDGAVPGRHRVTITPGGDSSPMPESAEEAARDPVVPFPVKYARADQSDLTAQVEAGKANQFDFNLTD
jgi:hypothetical protein